MSITTSSGSEEYTAAHIGKHWYAMKVKRLYSTQYPDGQVCTWPLSEKDGADSVYPRRKDALERCQREVDFQEVHDQRGWQDLVAHANPEPERIIHYQEIIEEITGSPALVDHCSWGVDVTALSFECVRCRLVHYGCYAIGQSEQEALARVAEQVYQDYADCLARPVHQSVSQMYIPA